MDVKKVFNSKQSPGTARLFILEALDKARKGDNESIEMFRRVGVEINEKDGPRKFLEILADTERAVTNGKSNALNKPKLTNLEPKPKLELEPQPKKIENRSNGMKNKWNNIGEFLVAVAEASKGVACDHRLGIKAAAGLNSSVQSEGGFLLEDEFVTELLQGAYESGLLASRAKKYPMSGDKNSISINALAETNRATGSRFGGVTGYWATEAGLIGSSKPAFRKVKFELNKLVGLIYTTDELVTDATALRAIMLQAFADEFGFLLDDAIFNGTGLGQPLGILKSPALITQDPEAAQAAKTVNFENISNMWSRMLPRSRRSAVWIINADVEPQLFTMTLSVGTGGAPVYMPANGATNQPYNTLFGRPVIVAEQASQLGAAGDIVLADLSQYAMVDKDNVKGTESIHVRFLTDENAFRFIYRVDGTPAMHSPVTPYKGTNTMSAFITLGAR